MEKINQFFISYSNLLNFLPEGARFIVAIAIIVILLIILFRFIQKSIIWLIVFILLLPVAWPALHEIGITLYNKVILPIIK